MIIYSGEMPRDRLNFRGGFLRATGWRRDLLDAIFVIRALLLYIFIIVQSPGRE